MAKQVIYFFAILFFSFSCNTKPIVLSISKSGPQVDSVHHGKDINISYVLTNSNDQKISIADFELSCPCTTTDLKKGITIPAHSNLKINFTINGSNLQPGGERIVNVAIRTNTNPELHIISMRIYVI